MYRLKYGNIFAILGILGVFVLYDWLNRNLSVPYFTELPIIRDGNLEETRELALFAVGLIAVVLVVKVLTNRDS